MPDLSLGEARRIGSSSWIAIRPAPTPSAAPCRSPSIATLSGCASSPSAHRLGEDGGRVGGGPGGGGGCSGGVGGGAGMVLLSTSLLGTMYCILLLVEVLEVVVVELVEVVKVVEMVEMVELVEI